MSKFRYAVLVNDKALGVSETSGAITIDLPDRGILQNITILWRHALTWVDAHLLPSYYAITKIEVLVNGSTVVKSISGIQLRALMWYNGGPFGQTNDYLQTGASNRNYDQFTLYFGRDAKDILYGLDLSKYANPQLKITFDEATVAYEGVTYDTDSEPAVVYNVMAKIMDSPPAGFLDKFVQTSEVDNWTIVAGTERNTEIPKGFPLRGIMLRSGYLNNAYNDAWEKIKLDFDNGTWVPIDMDYENFLRLHLEAWPKPVILGRYTYNAHGGSYNSELYYVCGSGGNTSRANLSYQKIPIIYWPISTVALYQLGGGTLGSPGAQTHIALGWGPMQTFYIPMKMLLDGAQEAIETIDYGRIDLKTTSGSGAHASSKAAVVLEYDKPNGS